MPRYRIAAAAAAFFVLLAAVAFVALLPGERGRAQESAPPNDNFDRPFTTAPSVSPLGNRRRRYAWAQHTAGATLEPNEPQPCVPIGATVWYLYYAPMTTKLTIDTTGSDYDTAAAIYHIDNFVPSPPGGSLSLIVCTDDGLPQKQAVLTADVEAGRTYAIQIGGVGGATGLLKILIDCVPFCPPENDSSSTPAHVSQLPYEDNPDTSGATLDPGEPADCGDMKRTVWYQLRNSTDTPVELNIFTNDSSFQTAVQVYELDSTVSPSPPGSLRGVRCAFGAAAPPALAFAYVAFVAEPGKSYMLQVGGSYGGGGRLDLRVSCRGDGCRISTPITAADNGGGADEPAPRPGGVRPPDTGSGGYLSRRQRELQH